MSHRMRFTQSVVLEPFLTRDAYHAKTYGTAVTVRAEVDYIIKNILDFTGNDTITSGWVGLPPGTSVNYEDRITMPDGSHPRICSISPAYNPRTKSNIYIEVYVSRVKPGETM